MAVPPRRTGGPSVRVTNDPARVFPDRLSCTPTRAGVQVRRVGWLRARAGACVVKWRACRPSSTAPTPPHPWRRSSTSPGWTPSSRRRGRPRKGWAGRRGSSSLPGVLADVPVAVLVIDQRAGDVVYANTAAVELAGHVSLPVDVDAWGSAAGLTDLSGEPLASSSGALSAVAQGRPVTGEAVRLAPGRSTEPERAEADGGDADRLLWVTGFPLTRVGHAEQLALVVFLSLELDETEDPEAALQALRERAVLATDITFTITDPRQPDNPLVWVNPSFTRVTGYPTEEAVGRNCRFLQGPATDPRAVADIRAAVAEARTVTTTRC